MRSIPVLELRDRSLLRKSAGFVLLIVSTLSASSALGEQATSPDHIRSVLVEVYSRKSDSERSAAISAIEGLKEARGGITVVLRDTELDSRNQDRLDAILRYYKASPQTSPVIFGCHCAIYDVSDSNSWESQLHRMLQMEVFVRTGCSHCAAVKDWMPEFMKVYPGLELVYHDIAVDSASATRLSRIVERHQTMAASVPVFYVADKLLVGFESKNATGERLQTILKRWTHETLKEKGSQQKPGRKPSVSMLFRSSGRLTNLYLAMQTFGTFTLQQSEEIVPDTQSATADDDLSLPLPSDDLSEHTDHSLPIFGTDIDGIAVDERSDNIEVPVFGRLSASKLGMPVFTLAVGLVDGFNPCAMWVLLFLLSILVNLKDRRRIIAVAGTFVIVSGLAYFAFMAAWLNVFLLIGYLRPIQVALALFAILIGAVHVKDFFAFKQGFSLSIPESAKPGIYARVRRIVTAEHLAGAVAGAIVMAILVNIIELLCTAGLPALYTNILVQQGLSPVSRYVYLALYILAYMFDDTLMVTIVVITLSKRKLQESQGRWLKLVSGAAILLLGIIMLSRPEWLH